LNDKFDFSLATPNATQTWNSPFIHDSSEDVGLSNNENVKKKLDANIEDNKNSQKLTKNEILRLLRPLRTYALVKLSLPTGWLQLKTDLFL